MQDNGFWIGQEQIPVDLSLLLTYSNDEDYAHPSPYLPADALPARGS